MMDRAINMPTRQSIVYYTFYVYLLKTNLEYLQTAMQIQAHVYLFAKKWRATQD